MPTPTALTELSDSPVLGVHLHPEVIQLMPESGDLRLHMLLRLQLRGCAVVTRQQRQSVAQLLIEGSPTHLNSFLRKSEMFDDKICAYLILKKDCFSRS